jgi:hypothetical protein
VGGGILFEEHDALTSGGSREKGAHKRLPTIKVEIDIRARSSEKEKGSRNKGAYGRLLPIKVEIGIRGSVTALSSPEIRSR